MLAALPVGAAELTDDYAALHGADVIVLGEIHDNPGHHARQARIVSALDVKAIVFEMLTPDEALAITPDIRGNAIEIARVTGWADSGWPDFSMYYPIFAAAPEAAIFGGDVPREAVRQAIGDGAGAVFGAASPLFGLDEALNGSEQAQREQGQQAAHCGALPEEMLPGMVEAQRLRDAALARAIIAALAEAGGPVAVITGNGHARTDWGVPRALAAARPDLEVRSLGQFEGDPGEDEALYHVWATSDPVERDDPCAAFR